MMAWFWLRACSGGRCGVGMCEAPRPHTRWAPRRRRSCTRHLSAGVPHVMWQGAYDSYCVSKAAAVLCCELSMYMPACMGVGCEECGLLAVLGLPRVHAQHGAHSLCMLYTSGTELLQAVH